MAGKTSCAMNVPQHFGHLFKTLAVSIFLNTFAFKVELEASFVSKVRTAILHQKESCVKRMHSRNARVSLHTLIHKVVGVRVKVNVGVHECDSSLIQLVNAHVSLSTDVGQTSLEHRLHTFDLSHRVSFTVKLSGKYH